MTRPDKSRPSARLRYHAAQARRVRATRRERDLLRAANLLDSLEMGLRRFVRELEEVMAMEVTRDQKRWGKVEFQDVGECAEEMKGS